ncbi:hypothetical protein RQP46_009562 [Phenoliferia psychrophenolica]
MSSEVTPLLSSPSPTPEAPQPEEEVSTKERLGRRLESTTAHWLVILLTSLDAVFVLCDIGFDFLKDQRCICTNSCPEDPQILEIFSWFSLGITSLFLIEIPLSLYCFGTQHYTSVSHAYLHLFDAVVIIVTFCLEVFLRGREAEIAGLLVLLRLWRLIKLVSTVSVDVTEYNDVEQRPRMHTPSTLPRDAADWWIKEKQELLDELDHVKAELDQVKKEWFKKTGVDYD